jgi:hypothetical protein
MLLAYLAFENLDASLNNLVVEFLVSGRLREGQDAEVVVCLWIRLIIGQLLLVFRDPSFKLFLRLAEFLLGLFAGGSASQLPGLGSRLEEPSKEDRTFDRGSARESL